MPMAISETVALGSEKYGQYFAVATSEEAKSRSTTSRAQEA
jgi:hypothetical protein